MAISFIGLFLVVGVIGLAVVALLAFAVAKGRLGLAALIGGLAVLFGIPVITIVVALFAYRMHAAPSMNTFPVVPDAVQQQWTDYQTVNNAPTWAIALRPALFMAVAFIALLFLLARRGMGHAAAGGHGKIWPVFVAVPILALFLLGGVRYEVKQSASTVAPAAQAVPSSPAFQIRSQIQHQQESLKKHQIELAKQQEALAKQATALAESLHKQIDQMDIQELMDKFDAPRIALKMPITPSPAALVIAAANAATDESKSDITASAGEIAATADAAKVDVENKSEAAAESEKSHSNGNDEHAKTTEPAEQTPEEPAEKPAAATSVVEAEAPASPTPPAPPAPAVEPPTAVPPVAAAPAPPAPAAVLSAKTIAVTHSTPETTKVELPIAGSTTISVDKETQTASTSPPSWINDPPKRTGDVRREVIETDPYSSADECYEAADVYLMLRTYERLQQLRGRPFVGAKLPSISFGSDSVNVDGAVIAVGRSPLAWTDYRFAQLNSMGIGADYLRREIVAKNPSDNEPREYFETVSSSFGPMRKLYMQIEFTPTVDRELMKRWEAYERQERFAVVAGGAAGALSLLLSVWGLLKLDTVTKGYYTKRLFIGVPAAIIMVILFCAADPFQMF